MFFYLIHFFRRYAFFNKFSFFAYFSITQHNQKTFLFELNSLVFFNPYDKILLIHLDFFTGFEFYEFWICNCSMILHYFHISFFYFHYFNFLDKISKFKEIRNIQKNQRIHYIWKEKSFPDYSLNNFFYNRNNFLTLFLCKNNVLSFIS